MGILTTKSRSGSGFLDRRQVFILVLSIVAMGHLAAVFFPSAPWLPRFHLIRHASIFPLMLLVKGYGQIKLEAAISLVFGVLLAHAVLFGAVLTSASIGVAFSKAMGALMEEMLIRVFLFDILFRVGMKAPSIGASALFAGIHALNLSRYSFASVANQILVAFGFGYFFQSLLARWRVLTIPVLVHLLVNLTFGRKLLLNSCSGRCEPLLILPNWSTLSGPVFLLFILLFLGLVFRPTLFKIPAPIQLMP